MNEAELFFEKNKFHISVLNSLPDSNMSDEEIALWILKGNHGDWLELNLDVNYFDFLEDEKKAVSSYVLHRDAQYGEGTHCDWMSCTLHGIDVNKTNVWNAYGYKEEPKYYWTNLGIKTKSIKKFCESLPFENFSRIRFMKLGANGYITPHNDRGSGIDWNRIWEYPLPINIAIDHPNECFMTIENSGIVPFVNGSAFLVNILKNHSVINFSNKERKHLIVHGFVGNQKANYCKLLADSYRTQYEKIQSKI